jgi:hypothetical protein
MLTQVREKLMAAGAQVWPVPGPAQIDAIWDVQLDNAGRRFAVEYRQRAPYPSELPLLEPVRTRLARHGRPLLAAPYISEGVGDNLRAHEWSWADEQGNVDLRAPDFQLRYRISRILPPHRLKGFPRSGAGLAIVRLLVSKFAAGSPRSSDLAKTVGVTQARASQVLGQLERLSLIERIDAGWLPNREALMDAFLMEYRGPGGDELPFLTLDEPASVARRIVASYPRRVGISADVGPDLIISWRRPTLAVIYSEAPISASNHRLTPSERREDANILLRYPSDSSVFPTVPLTAVVDGDEVPLADPLQMLWDLLKLGGEDRKETAGRLRKWILENP